MVAPHVELTHEEVLAAGRLLFGPAFGAHARGWREALRATYRRRALETHPDRARAVGRSEAELALEFHAVADAYRVLSTVRAWPARRAAPPPARRPAARPVPRDGARGSRPAAEPARAASRPARPRPAGASAGPLPARRLRLAEYLHHAGYVPLSARVEAVAWQRARRPPIGRIAVAFGFLAPADVAALLSRRRASGASGLRFGEFAVREGLLTPFQLLACLGRQLKGHRRIGSFFVERGLVGEAELEEALRRLARHNARQR
jgi:hypothetical protein